MYQSFLDEVIYYFMYLFRIYCLIQGKVFRPYGHVNLSPIFCSNVWTRPYGFVNLSPIFCSNGWAMESDLELFLS